MTTCHLEFNIWSFNTTKRFWWKSMRPILFSTLIFILNWLYVTFKDSKCTIKFVAMILLLFFCQKYKKFLSLILFWWLYCSNLSLTSLFSISVVGYSFFVGTKWLSIDVSLTLNWCLEFFSSLLTKICI